MEEKLKRILEETVEHDAFGLHRVDEAAAEIAKLWSEEQDELIQDLGMERIAHQICKNALQTCGEECGKLLAQVADMAWAIEDMLRALDDKADFDKGVEHLESALAHMREVKDGRED